MSVVGIKQSAWVNLRNNQKAILRWSTAKLALGVPARYLDEVSAEWFAFSDWRISLKQVAYLGALVASIGDLPVDWEYPTLPNGEIDREATEALVVDYVKDVVVLPEDITYSEEDENPWQTTLDAQGAPPAIRAGNAIPETWTALEATT